MVGARDAPQETETPEWDSTMNLNASEAEHESCSETDKEQTAETDRAQASDCAPPEADR